MVQFDRVIVLNFLDRCYAWVLNAYAAEYRAYVRDTWQYYRREARRQRSRLVMLLSLLGMLWAMGVTLPRKWRVPSLFVLVIVKAYNRLFWQKRQLQLWVREHFRLMRPAISVLGWGIRLAALPFLLALLLSSLFGDLSSSSVSSSSSHDLQIVPVAVLESSPSPTIPPSPTAVPPTDAVSQTAPVATLLTTEEEPSLDPMALATTMTLPSFSSTPSASPVIPTEVPSSIVVPTATEQLPSQAAQHLQDWPTRSPSTESPQVTFNTATVTLEPSTESAQREESTESPTMTASPLPSVTATATVTVTITLLPTTEPLTDASPTETVVAITITNTASPTTKPVNTVAPMIPSMTPVPTTQPTTPVPTTTVPPAATHQPTVTTVPTVTTAPTAVSPLPTSTSKPTTAPTAIPPVITPCVKDPGSPCGGDPIRPGDTLPTITLP